TAPTDQLAQLEEQSAQTPSAPCRRVRASAPMMVVFGGRSSFETRTSNDPGFRIFKSRLTEARTDDPRQRVELVELGRRRQGPFECRRAASPRIGARRRFA